MTKQRIKQFTIAGGEPGTAGWVRLCGQGGRIDTHPLPNATTVITTNAIQTKRSDSVGVTVVIVPPVACPRWFIHPYRRIHPRNTARL